MGHNVPKKNTTSIFTSYTNTINLILLLSIIPHLSEGSADSWCYDKATCGPSTWGGTCTSGQKQSPINIITSKVTKNGHNTRIILNRNYVVPKAFFLKNTGHTVQLSVNANGKSKCFFTGDGLGAKTPFYFSQLHFHWGPNNMIGSEHRISGKSYPLEMHMVHYLLKDPNRIAVIAVLFYLSPRDNPGLVPIIAQLEKIKQPLSQIKVTSGPMMNLTSLLPKKMRMFRYIGSLTTPPCTENVIWTVFRDPLPVSRKQMERFRKLNDDTQTPMTLNYRPLQPAFTQKRKSIYFVRQFRRSRVVLQQQQQGQGTKASSSSG